jgi:signal transduction histidine kinase
LERVKIKIRKIILVFICIFAILYLSKLSKGILSSNFKKDHIIDQINISFMALNDSVDNDTYNFMKKEYLDDEKWSSVDEFSSNTNNYIESNTLLMRIKLNPEKWTNPAVYFKSITAKSYKVYLNGRCIYKSSESFLGFGQDLDKLYTDTIVPLGRPSDEAGTSTLTNEEAKQEDIMLELLPMSIKIPQEVIPKKDEIENLSPKTEAFTGDILIIELEKGNNRQVAPFYFDESIVNSIENSILIGEHKDIVNYIFKGSIIKIVLNSVIAASAIIFLILGFFFRDRDRRMLLSLSLFIFCMGVYGISNIRSINSLIVDFPILWSYLLYISIGYAPYAFVLFFEQIFGTGYKGLIRKMRKTAAVAASIVIITNLTLTVTKGVVNIIGLSTTVFYIATSIVIVITLIASIIGAVKGDTEAKIFTAGISIYTAFIVDAVRAETTVSEVGLLLFILSLILLTARRFINMSRNIVSYSKDMEVKNEALQSAWDEVNKSKQEVSELNKTLEKRVLDRTKELEGSNKSLKEALEKLQLTQNQLVQSEKMVALGGLVAGVSHEINTPVGVSVTAASHLQEKTKEITSLFTSSAMKKSDLERYLNLTNEGTEVILSNLARASELIKSFKQVAVDQSSEGKRKFNVREYIFQVLLSLKPKLKKTNIHIGVNCDDKLEIESYPGALSQIITNLIMNSLVHAFEEGEEGAIIFDVEKQDKNLIFTYSDNGKGISKDIIGKIFDPFFTTKRGKGGTGLGLNIVYNIITQTLEGTIECESEVGIGTIFKIIIPIS